MGTRNPQIKKKQLNIYFKNNQFNKITNQSHVLQATDYLGVLEINPTV